MKALLSTRSANAYSAFPCGGEYIPAGFIREIVVDGHTAYKRRERSVRVFSEDTAYLIDDMLKTAAKEGTAKKLRTLPFPIAAKTGTGGTKNGNNDAYTLSYTTEDCVGVWLGYADNSPMDITGGGIPCNIALKIKRIPLQKPLPRRFPKTFGGRECFSR